MKKLIVDKKYNEKKLNNFILNSFPNLNKNNLYKALRKKDIKINDVRVNENVTVHTGDDIKIYISDDLLYPSNFTLEIVFEDDNILVINKPVGIEVVGSNSLTTECENYLNSFVKPCHRLDRNTCGLVIFAKNEQALNILLDKFKNREIEKYYKATVYGILPKKHDRLEAYLFKDNKKSLVYISSTPKKGYQKIITSYKVLSENKEDNTSILNVKLETGRTHQIRAHLAYLGYPIIGDRKIWN